MVFFRKKVPNFDKKYLDKFGKKGNQPAVIRKLVLPKMEAYLESEYKKLQERSERNALDLAKQLKPTKNNDQLAPYLQYMADTASGWCNHIMVEMQVGGLNDFKANAIRFAKNEQAKLEGLKYGLDNELRNLKEGLRKIEKRDIYIWSWFPFWMGVVFLGLFGETIYNAQAFQAIGLSFGTSLAVVVTTTIGLTFGGYLLVVELLKDETERRYKWAVPICLAIIFFFFSLLGYFRTAYLNEMNDFEIPMMFSTVTFLFFNLIIFSCISALLHATMPTKEQFRVRNERVKIEKAIKELEEKREAVLDNMATLKEWLEDNLQMADDLMNNYNGKLVIIVGVYRKIASDWIREMTTRLPHTPDCFSQQFPRVNCRPVDIKDHTKLLNEKNEEDEE